MVIVLLLEHQKVMIMVQSLEAWICMNGPDPHGPKWEVLLWEVQQEIGLVMQLH